MPRLFHSTLLRLPTSLLLALAAITLAFVHSHVAVAAADKNGEKKPLQWVADLKSPTQGTRNRATSALARLKPTPPEVAIATADLLKDKDWSVRAQVLMVLGNMGADASIVLPQIMATLDDENKHVRRSAANALTRVPAATSKTRLALVRALESDDRHLRSQAGRALAAAPGDSATIAPELARIAVSDNRQASMAAFNVLEKLPANVVPLLVPMLSSEDQQTRQNAARVIGNFGPEASAAVPTLITLLDKYPHYLMAVHTLGRIGPGAKAAVPALLALFERSDPSRQLRLAVTGALTRIGPEPKQVRVLFSKELAQQDMSEASGRYRAALASAILTMSGPDDPAIRSYVKRLARDQRSWQPFTRVEAVKGLVAMGPAAAPAMVALRDSLRNDEEPKIRALAAQALGEIGSAAHPALPDLRKAQQEDEAYVSKRAAAAIAKIEASAQAAAPVATTTPLAPVDEHAERQKEIAADLAAVSSSGSRRVRASLRLLERAPDSLPAMHRALLAPDTRPQDRSSLIALVQDLGDPRTVEVIIKTTKATPEQPGLRSEALRALAELPPSPASFEFATRVLEDPGANVQVQRQALLYFAKHRDQRGSRWAKHFADDDDANMRIVSLYLAASLGDPQTLQPIATLLQEQPRHSGRYALLLGLADLADLAEFEKLTKDQPKDQEYESVLRLARLRVAQGKERVPLARQMLNSHFPNERRIAMDALLKANAVSELNPLLKQWGSVPPQTRATIAAGLYRAGYQFVERDRSLGIERLPPINKDANAW